MRAECDLSDRSSHRIRQTIDERLMGCKTRRSHFRDVDYLHFLAVFATVLLVGCEGQIGDPFTSEGRGTNPTTPHSAQPIALRRLSGLEADATLRDLTAELGISTQRVTALPTPPVPIGSVRHTFSNTREPGNLTSNQTANLIAWAEEVSLALTEDLPGSLGCTPVAAWDNCVSGFAQRLARLTSRRTPSQEKLARLEQLYLAATGDTDPRDGVRALWEATLLSADFWYLVPEEDSSRGGLSAFAKASRLSYSLWGTMPDAELLVAAEDGSLHDRSVLRAQVERLVDDPRAEETLARFHREWLGLEAGARLQKDADLYPEFTAQTSAYLETEFDGFFREVIRGGGNVGELFTSRFGYVNRELEQLLGIEPEASDNSDWVWRDLGAARAGAFTRPLYLASKAGAGESSLIHRGVGVIEFGFCEHLVPPDDAISMAFELEPNATSGKLAAVEHRASIPLCNGCHSAIDPLGMAFEAFDAVGGLRSAYPDGVAIPQDGTLDSPLVSLEPVAYASGADLIGTLATDSRMQSCYASKWVEWTTGRIPVGEELPEVERLATAGRQSVRNLLVELAMSPLTLGANR